MKKDEMKIEAIKGILDEIEDNKKPIAKALYKELIFMNKALEETKKNIHENGVVEWFEQGPQKFYKESAGSKTYLKYQRNFNQTLKQLSDLLPEDHKEEADEFITFIRNG